MSDNPFLDPAFHVRWSALKPEAVGPGIDAALAKAQAAIDLIASRDPGTVTYENTFLALEHATEELNVAWAKVTHLQAVADSPAWREAHNLMLPKVSAFYASIPLNAALWERLKTFANSREASGVMGIHRRFLDETVKDFRQAGADLPPEKRTRLEAIQTELAQLTQKYAENVLDATNGWQRVIPDTDEQRLAGLPAHAKAAARRSAEAKGSGGWRFTLHMPSQEPFMTYLEDQALRQEMWTAATRVGAQEPHDNTRLISRIIVLRAEKASLLGKPHFADLTLERRMAKSGQRALDFMTDLQR
ncbi:MAG: M3 family metallopeptidase, partial [Opitutaceae bacterium]